MAPLQNDRFLRALLREPVDRTPIWLMRQAGRYLPEYRATRAQAGSFMGLCTQPELACEVTMQPLRRYDMDAAILFSDILTIPDALGLGLYFTEGEGPRFERPLSSEADIAALEPNRARDELGYVMDAVALIRKELNGKVPLIGFSGSPWTLATYMIEGGSSKDFAKTKSLAFNNPAAMHQLLDKLADAVAVYLSTQVEQGAQVLQIFDTWGGHSVTATTKSSRFVTCARLLSVYQENPRDGAFLLSYLPKVAGSGLNTLLTVVRMQWDSTGRQISQRRARAWETKSHYRAIWTRPC